MTPIAAARRLAGLPGRFLLHSGSNVDETGRYSFVGARPDRVLSCDFDSGLDPFAAAEALADGPPRPGPRVVAIFGYELGRAVERLAPPRPRPTWDLWLARYPAIWCHDARTGRSEIFGDTRAACAQLAEDLARAERPACAPRFGPLEPEAAAAGYQNAVARALDYIRAGDIYQVNLSRRLSAALIAPGDPLSLYEALAPAPFGAVIETDRGAVISNSPELFLRRAAGSDWVETRPIKGTRARGRDAVGDAELIAELAGSEKDRAEHLMIVDLLRNDFGRVAEIGSVAVRDFQRVVTFPTVHHLISTIVARPHTGTAELLRACFPGGSITGAPKVRAMQIIDELEATARGVYTGAIGWLGSGGALDLAIAIRTAVLGDERLTLAVGGGIVADSTPVRELEETEEKAAAFRRALDALTAGRR